MRRETSVQDASHEESNKLPSLRDALQTANVLGVAWCGSYRLHRLRPDRYRRLGGLFWFSVADVGSRRLGNTFHQRINRTVPNVPFMFGMRVKFAQLIKNYQPARSHALQPGQDNQHRKAPAIRRTRSRPNKHFACRAVQSHPSHEFAPPYSANQCLLEKP